MRGALLLSIRTNDRLFTACLFWVHSTLSASDYLPSAAFWGQELDGELKQPEPPDRLRLNCSRTSSSCPSRATLSHVPKCSGIVKPAVMGSRRRTSSFLVVTFPHSHVEVTSVHLLFEGKNPDFNASTKLVWLQHNIRLVLISSSAL